MVVFLGDRLYAVGDRLVKAGRQVENLFLEL